MNNRGSEEDTLVLPQFESCFAQPLDNLVQSCQMLLFCWACHQYVVQIDDHSRNSTEEALHHPLEYPRCGRNSIWQMVVLGQPTVGIHHCVFLGAFFQWQWLICLTHVEFRKGFSSYERRKEILDLVTVSLPGSNSTSFPIVIIVELYNLANQSIYVCRSRAQSQ